MQCRIELIQAAVIFLKYMELSLVFLDTILNFGPIKILYQFSLTQLICINFFYYTLNCSLYDLQGLLTTFFTKGTKLNK